MLWKCKPTLKSYILEIQGGTKRSQFHPASIAQSFIVKLMKAFYQHSHILAFRFEASLPHSIDNFGIEVSIETSLGSYELSHIDIFLPR